MSENHLTLLDIESSLAQLIEVREMAETPEEITAADEAIAGWVKAEVQKVDGVRSYRRWLKSVFSNAKAEEKFQAKRAELAEEAIARLDETIIGVMESVGKTKLEGRTGSLRVQGNGGLQPLTVNLEVLPQGVILYSVPMHGDALEWLKRFIREHKSETHPLIEYYLYAADDGEPDNEKIRGLIGAGQDVPGARLEDRGKHVRI